MKISELESKAKAAQAALSAISHSRKIKGDAAITLGASTVLRMCAALREIHGVLEHRGELYRRDLAAILTRHGLELG